MSPGWFIKLLKKNFPDDENKSKTLDVKDVFSDDSSDEDNKEYFSDGSDSSDGESKLLFISSYKDT